MTAGLPYIDEHAIEIDAPPERVWPALRGITGGASRPADFVGGILGVRDREARGDPLTEGATVLGFHVERAVPPSELALAGEHRFSRYALIFRVDPFGGGRSRLRAETRAEFPGPAGTVYRALVIGTRGHVLGVRRMLRTVKRRAEKI